MYPALTNGKLPLLSLIELIPRRISLYPYSKGKYRNLEEKFNEKTRSLFHNIPHHCCKEGLIARSSLINFEAEVFKATVASSTRYYLPAL
jgi:hypothetical protein